MMPDGRKARPGESEEEDTGPPEQRERNVKRSNNRKPGCANAVG